MEVKRLKPRQEDVFDVDFSVDLDFETAPPPFYEEDAAATPFRMYEEDIPPPPSSRTFDTPTTTKLAGRELGWDHNNDGALHVEALSKARDATYGKLRSVPRPRSRGISRWELPWTRPVAVKIPYRANLHFEQPNPNSTMTKKSREARAPSGLKRIQSMCLPIFL